MDSNTAFVEDTVDVLASADFTPVIKYFLIIIPHFRTETVTVTESTLTSPQKVTISDSVSWKKKKRLLDIRLTGKQMMAVTVQCSVGQSVESTILPRLQHKCWHFIG